MAYTPINWQTGDTITAEKMNKMDNGWGVESTQLFSETVTTADTGEGDSAGELIYSALISADTIIVTLDGTDYTCPRIEFEGANFYGGFNAIDLMPDFSVYPFFIYSSDEINQLITETAGTFAISAKTAIVEISSSFVSAVNASIPELIPPLKLVEGETTLSEFNDARSQARFCYLWMGTNQYVVNRIAIPSAGKTPLVVYPTPSDGSFAFDSNDILRFYNE